MSQAKMISVKCLTSITGAYPCAPEMADHISPVLTENSDGQLVTTRKAFKKFKGFQRVERDASERDIADNAERIAKGEAPSIIDGRFVQEADVLQLPQSYVDDNKLVERGLVEIVKPVTKPKTAAKAVA